MRGNKNPTTLKLLFTFHPRETTSLRALSLMFILGQASHAGRPSAERRSWKGTQRYSGTTKAIFFNTSEKGGSWRLADICWIITPTVNLSTGAHLKLMWLFIRAPVASTWNVAAFEGMHEHAHLRDLVWWSAWGFRLKSNQSKLTCGQPAAEWHRIT